MEFGLQLGRIDIGRARDVAQAAEALGFHALLVPDHLAAEGPERQLDLHDLLYDAISDAGKPGYVSLANVAKLTDESFRAKVRFVRDEAQRLGRDGSIRISNLIFSFSDENTLRRLAEAVVSHV